MLKRYGILLFLLFAALFLIVNRGAYRGYFQDDELQTLSWAPLAPPIDYVTGLLTPLFQKNDFRPVGHLYYHLAGHFFGLDFPKYVAVIHIFHLLNVWLVWLLLRRLGAPPLAAATACFFFGFHMALFDAFWKPMYVFDVLCATFCLLSVLLWTHQRWILSFLAFGLAYKSKELAVMLPAVLLCYEMWFGQRRWKPLIPFFAVSLSFGLQGLLLNPNHRNDYTFHFTPSALFTTSAYYASRVFFIPYLGFLVALGALSTRNRRGWLGLAMMGLFFLPLLFLPGRLFSAYCYLPFVGLALAFSGIAEGVPPIWVTAFFLVWVPVDYYQMRTQRSVTLANDNEARVWMGTLSAYTRNNPPAETFLYLRTPGAYHRWGVVGALEYLYKRTDLDGRVHPVEERNSAAPAGRTVLLAWNKATLKLDIAEIVPGQDASYVDIAGAAPDWQLEDGWYFLEGTFRWTEPTAVARLDRPQGARLFELRVLIGSVQLQTVGPLTVQVSLNDQPLEPRRFTASGWQITRWDLPPAPAGPVRVKFHTEPPLQPVNDPRVLGIAVGAFGFR